VATPALTPVTATSLADEIAFRLRSDILDGALAPGTRLQQDELCTRFGVSRTPVREALRQLQALNLITLAPSRGATVRAPSRQELLDVYELRARAGAAAREYVQARLGAAERGAEMVERALKG
jgi:DNA-binding GntR family transcriptional regulator